MVMVMVMVMVSVLAWHLDKGNGGVPRVHWRS
jgi:hypothetical protein